jgi:hypothetical protein
MVPRKVDVSNLVGAAEIAQRLGSKRTSYVHDLRRRHPDFPQPALKVKAALLWEWSAVEKWAKATGRLK